MMMKVKYDDEEWAIAKDCGYCGKKFYPIGAEDFCDYPCQDAYEDYGRWLMEITYEKEI